MNKRSQLKSNQHPDPNSFKCQPVTRRPDIVIVRCALMIGQVMIVDWELIFFACGIELRIQYSYDFWQKNSKLSQNDQVHLSSLVPFAMNLKSELKYWTPIWDEMFKKGVKCLRTKTYLGRSVSMSGLAQDLKYRDQWKLLLCSSEKFYWNFCENFLEKNFVRKPHDPNLKMKVTLLTKSWNRNLYHVESRSRLNYHTNWTPSGPVTWFTFLGIPDHS